MIAIIDYGSGNIAAIANIYKQLKIPHAVTKDARELAAAERYILPGVGAFDATMRHLSGTGVVGVLQEQVIEGGKKLMGVCVGMQILAESSEEGDLPGLGWIAGRVRKIGTGLPIPPPILPHMGWNSIDPKQALPIFSGIDPLRGFYFLHNYYFDAARSEDVIATVTYGSAMPCSVNRCNIFGMQFHPEKSHVNGVAIFRNFARI